MILKKLATGLATAAILASGLMPVVYAENNEIINNGADSHNVIETGNTTETTVEQSNATVAFTLVVASSNSGGNSASQNTGGDVSIETGKAVTNVGVTVTGGNNTATINDCGCPVVPTDNVIRHNGADSYNKISDKTSKKTNAGQGNTTFAGTGAFAFSDSGNNKADKNTNGTTSVKTKKSRTSVNVDVTGGHNTLNP